MGWESFGVVRFDFGPLLQGQTRIAKLFFFFFHLNIFYLPFFHKVFSTDPGRARVANPPSGLLYLVLHI